MNALLAAALLGLVLGQSVSKHEFSAQKHEQDGKQRPSPPTVPAPVPAQVSQPAPSPKQEGSQSEHEDSFRKRFLDALVSNWPLVVIGIPGIWAALWTLQAINRQTATVGDTAKRQLRAYVGIDSSLLTFKGRIMPEAQVHIKNCGQTPAYDVRHWIHNWIAEHPLKVILPEPPDGFQMSKAVLSPGGHHIMVTPEKPPLSADVLQIFGTPQCTLYVYGEVRYRNIFGETWYTKYRLIYGGAYGGRQKIEGSVVTGLLQPDTEGNEAT